MPQILMQRYGELHPLLVEVATRVKSTLASFCEKNGYAFVCRVKTAESLAEKIETGRFRRWSEIDDLPRSLNHHKVGA